MKIKTVRLDTETRDVLMRSRIDGNNLTLPEQLERKLYDKVAKAIEAAGGKWKRSARCHVFPSDVRETLDIAEDTVQVVNVQQTYQAFYTPLELADHVVELAEIREGHTVLEPSAGKGAIVQAVRRQNGNENCITAIEIDAKQVDLLAHASHVVWGDFLQWSGYQFDRIVMNPPFTGGQDITHIKHARSMLAPGGRLVAICGNGAREQAELKPIVDSWEDVPAGAFHSSGTDVATAIITIEN